MIVKIKDTSLSNPNHGSQGVGPSGLAGGMRKGPLMAIMVLLATLFLAFQNCSGGADDESVSPGATGGRMESGSPVSVIDPVSAISAWKLNSAKVEVGNSVDQLAVLGSCEGQDDAALEWRVENVASGFALCTAGAFQVDLRPLQELECGRRAEIIGRQGAKSGVLAEVVRRCAPDQVKVIESLKETLTPEPIKMVASQCQVEVSTVGGCHHVCYGADGRVVHEIELAGAICNL